MSKWTKEPWFYSKYEFGTHYVYGQPNGKSDGHPQDVMCVDDAPGATVNNIDRAIACVNACAGIPDPIVIPDAMIALRTLSGLLADGTLCRDISRDHEDGWHLRMIGLVKTLKDTHDIVAELEGK